ncbi:MAG: hypothetical protein ACTHOO_01275 [Alcanivorax sp.]
MAMINADLEKAVKLLPLNDTFALEDRKAQIVAIMPDMRPLDAPWWTGKEVYLIAVDVDGNFFLRHCDGSVRYWDHKTQTDVTVSKSLKEFVKLISKRDGF